MPHFSARDNIPALLEACARDLPEHVYCKSDSEQLTYLALNRRVNQLAHGLLQAGIQPGDRVAVMLSHHIEHALSFLALTKLGAVQIPVNVHLKGAGLQHVLGHSDPAFIIVDSEYAEALAGTTPAGSSVQRIWRGAMPAGEASALAFAELAAHPNQNNPGIAVSDSDLRAILYTSGTTGPAKGVQMTDRMYRAAALGSIWIGDIKPGSVLHFWDPIYHVFGSEVLVLALMRPVTLGFVPRFSASKFWAEVRQFGATHVHFVGGVLQLLLKQAPSETDKQSSVRIAWGGGAPVEVWREFQERFGIEVREGYGMTETSSFSVINLGGPLGSIGKAIDYFEVQVVDDAGTLLPAGKIGEMRVAEKEPGVLTTGYFRNSEKTAEALRGGWLYTGDLARTDEDGNIFFLGRKKDSLRRRGENISAWEVEQVVNGHPQVEESALIGVVNEFQDEDLKLFIKLKPGMEALDPAGFVEWCRSRMAAFQIPRFIAIVEEFPKTPTQRIQKQSLPVSVDDCWDGSRKASA
jgi:crotonobetaine/carnitine-CoA ligase